MSADLEARAGIGHPARDDDAEVLYDRAPCGYLSSATDGRIIKVNQTFLDWTGRSRVDVVGRRLLDLLTPGGRIFYETHYAPTLTLHGRAAEIAFDLVRADGTRLPALVTTVVERGPTGDEVWRSAIFDMTERRRYERDLVSARERAEGAQQRAAVLAETLQRALIPPAPATIPHLDVAAAYRAAASGAEIGGDFYDVFQVAADDWVVVIGDVQGKGVDAALVTLLLRHSARAAAVEHPMPSHVLRILNTVLLNDSTDRLCTAIVARLRRDQGSWTITLAAAGHPLPLLRRAGQPATTIGKPGMLLGHFDEARFADVATTCWSGDEIVLYTDGVSEARRGQEWFGEAGILDALVTEQPTADGVAAELLERVLDFQAGQPRDDIAIVVIRVPEFRPGDVARQDPSVSKVPEPGIVVLAVHTSRDLKTVRDSLGWLPLPREVLADVVLAASEVVTNALQYSGGSCEFRAHFPTHRGGIRVEVSDGASGPLPRPNGRVRADALRGRGLHIVDTLTSRWGVDDRAPHGKTVWFEVDPVVQGRP